ncbi:MAG: hypothetical protein GX308_08910 [Epulopiscium sp.]|nr:hypothetical protein [Candidatus Epulonipiscium sp.]
MEKEVMASASYYAQKYYSNPEFDEIPIAIKDDIKFICISLAEKLQGIFSMGFYKNGDIYFEIKSDEKDYDFDEIGASLEIKKLEKENKELIRMLKIWYRIYKTKEGEAIKETILKRDK